MIVAAHVATGAAGGALAGSRLGALALGPVLHYVCDRVPHWDIASRDFEVWSGVLGLLALGARRGPLDPATIGAAASSAPDLEHMFRFLRPGGRKHFPSHVGGRHRVGGVRTWVQLLAAGVLLGAVLASRR